MSTHNSNTNSLESILHQLNDGKRLTLSFPSKKEREAFRIALYKTKRDVDEVFLMTDPEFEISALRFDKEFTESSSDPELNSIKATIYLQSKAALQANARSYNFNIIEVSEDHGNPTDSSSSSSSTDNPS